MATFKCKMCGGSLEIAEGMTVCECEYCGTQQTLPKTDNEQTLSMFNRANHFRQQCEFDKAAEIYERMTAQSDDAELYWSIVLCRYGIEYVDDPLTHKKIATCHRTQYKSILEDADYLEALSHADSIQRSVYEREAAYIDKVQKGILEISNKEQPFDVFICYKESDQNGRRTQDSVLAQELYYQLEREGFKVFFSRITLESKLGTEYEPYIFAALNSARVMVVVGTKPEYFNAVWVKNEWSRYLMLMQQDRSRVLIPAYKDMDPYDLPDALSLFQAQDMSKLGFMQDLIRGISKIAHKDEPKPAAAPSPVQTVVQKASGNVENLLKRGFLSLEDKKWDDANRFFEDVLNENVEEPRAYIGKLCAEKNVTSEKELVTLQNDFSGSDNYRKACRFGGEEVETRLHGYILQGVYNKAAEMLKQADTVEKCNEAKELFVWLGKYKDMSSPIDTCKNKASKIRYDEAIMIMNSAMSDEGFAKAASVFESLNGFLDSAQKASECRAKAEKILHDKEEMRKANIYKDADVDIENASKNRLSYAIEVFRKIRGYRDVDEKIAKCEARIKELEEQENAEKAAAEKKAKQKKLIKLFVGLLIVASIAGIIIYMTVFLPKSQYNKAVGLLEAKNYDEAISAFESLNGYEDSADKVSEIKYYKALDLVDCKHFDEAKEIFTELGDYKDASEQISIADLEQTYVNAVATMNDGRNDVALDLFKKLGDYKDSKSKYDEIMQIINQKKYDNAMSEYNKGYYQEAKTMFYELGEFGNSQEMYNESTYNIANDLLNDKKYKESIDIFKSLGDYKDSKDKIEKAYSSWYSSAKNLMKSGKYDKAIDQYSKMNNYKDSNKMMTKCKELKSKEAEKKIISKWKNGDYRGALNYYNQNSRAYYINKSFEKVISDGGYKQQFLNFKNDFQKYAGKYYKDKTKTWYGSIEISIDLDNWSFHIDTETSYDYDLDYDFKMQNASYTVYVQWLDAYWTYIFYTNNGSVEETGSVHYEKYQKI